MSLIFYWRAGDGLYARRSPGGSLGVTPAGGYTQTNDAAVLGGVKYLAASNNNAKVILWPGRLNTPATQGLSIMARLIPGYTGKPTSTRPLLPFLAGGCGRFGRLELSHTLTSGNTTWTAQNEAAATMINAVNMGVYDSPGSSTEIDVVTLVPGTTTANAHKLYIDASLIGSTTAGAARSASWNANWVSEIAWGNGFNSVYQNAGSIIEIAIWDEIIDPTSVTLESGSGSLNGASRTSLIACANTLHGEIAFPRGRIVNR